MANDSGLASPQPSGEVARIALAGLLAPRKTLPAKLFYDDEGCRLFYRITELPEYYLTRTERVLLNKVAPLVASRMPAGSVLVEYGASDEEKAGFLLRAGGAAFSTYIPIDVAAFALRRMQARLDDQYPQLAVHPIVADFLQPVALPPVAEGTTRLGFFPGSTIGNLEPADATAFLSRVRAALGTGGQFLLGADLRKDPSVLIPAYDDSAGVTAAFNLNLLARLNREAGADFDLEAFSHLAVWNDLESRIEMHLVSRREQIVQINGARIAFAEGETIHTENSYKHTAERTVELAQKAGWRLREKWTDPAELFALFLFGSGQEDESNIK